MNNKEYILCAAIHYDDGNVHVHQPKNIKIGFVVAGRRHHNCFATVALLRDGKPYRGVPKIQGFITNTDRFVDRKEAFIIARDAGQLLYEVNETLDPILSESALLSEDVW